MRLVGMHKQHDMRHGSQMNIGPKRACNRADNGDR